MSPGVLADDSPSELAQGYVMEMHVTPKERAYPPQGTGRTVGARHTLMP
ncbi:MAG TPA: hypothetical protein VFD82_15100 [Planctomycetota bacterium]|nr:hypothetical protein [Planctomycetota bacterium]